jgi:hypothetical protein
VQLQPSAAPVAALGVLTSAITPAVLILATSSLIAATSGRLGRVVDRARRLGDEFEALASTVPSEKFPAEELAEERALAYDQLRKATSRAILLQRSMSALYLALSLFVGSSVTIGLEAAIGWRHPTIPVVVAMGGVAVMLYAALLLLAESRIALRAIDREMGFTRRLGDRYAPAELLAARRTRWWERED